MTRFLVKFICVNYWCPKEVPSIEIRIFVVKRALLYVATFEN